ncbi:hypothetical protein RHGRI_014066 [Rhododendron griersonianum]|uniref:FAR1 domain-containing protein n=1 Tax=Rhododendron griersonianum TaxID=479676 RepID=A0AAV6K8F5_9ERIC|nr:hypothetical protein RHGRI_014066 [Rhododendron griersonianum]
MEFDTSNEAYLYYSRYDKENGFAVAKRTSQKGRDGNLRHVSFECTRAGKARYSGGGPDKLPYLEKDCQKFWTKIVVYDFWKEMLQQCIVIS